VRLRGCVFDFGRRRKRTCGAVTAFYAESDGFAVLRSKKTWRKLNGVMINTRWGHVWVVFRRWVRA